MLREEQLLCAMGAVEERDILEAARAMGYLPGAIKAKKNLWRPLLIAAALTALLTATAVAATLLGRAERLAPMPTAPNGVQRQAEIPNGFRGTPTYQGSAAWWEYMAHWQDSHDTAAADISLDFIQGDLDRYLVCSLYGAYDREQADTLYRIAEEYDLGLCREMVHCYDDMEEFLALTGAEPFLEQQGKENFRSSILEDGSFRLEGDMVLDGLNRQITLRRCISGSIYPFGGAQPLRDYEETEYVTGRGHRVFIDIFGPGQAEITYQDPTGQVYISLEPRIFETEDPLTLCRQAADSLDFQALCSLDTEKILEILSQPTGAEENPQAVTAVQKFQESPAFLGAAEFGKFYQENFYGPCFTGTYGLEGYGDIDSQLEAIASRRGLLFAREKTVTGRERKQVIDFDNGARQLKLRGQVLHCIPKNALYTMMPGLPDIRLYRRVWPYETGEGQQLVLFTQGPEGGSWAFLDGEETVLLLKLWGGSPTQLERQTEEFDWSALEKGRERP